MSEVEPEPWLTFKSNSSDYPHLSTQEFRRKSVIEYNRLITESRCAIVFFPLFANMERTFGAIAEAQGKQPKNTTFTYIEIICIYIYNYI
jgi:hypothetical protein